MNRLTINIVWIFILFGFAVFALYVLYNDNPIDESVLKMLELQQAKSEEVLERRKLVNLVMFQQTGIIFSLIFIPLAIAFYQNTSIFKRHKQRASKAFRIHHVSKRDSLFNRLLLVNPDLTPYELKLCTLLHRGLNSKEIASELNITQSSANTARYRLRKKLGIPSEQELLSFLHKV